MIVFFSFLISSHAESKQIKSEQKKERYNYEDLTQLFIKNDSTFQTKTFFNDQNIKTLSINSSPPISFNVEVILALIYSLFNQRDTRAKLLNLLINADEDLSKINSDESFARIIMKHIADFLEKKNFLNDSIMKIAKEEQLYFANSILKFLTDGIKNVNDYPLRETSALFVSSLIERSAGDFIKESTSSINVKSNLEEFFNDMIFEKETKTPAKYGKLPYYLDGLSNKNVFLDSASSISIKSIMLSFEGLKMKTPLEDKIVLDPNMPNIFSIATEKSNTGIDKISKTRTSNSLNIKLNNVALEENSISTDLKENLEKEGGFLFFSFPSPDIHLKILVRQIMIGGIITDIVFIFGIDFVSIIFGDGTSFIFSENDHLRYKPNSAFGSSTLSVPHFLLGTLVTQENKNHVYQSNDRLYKSFSPGSIFSFFNFVDLIHENKNFLERIEKIGPEISSKGTVLNFSSRSFSNQEIESQIICYDNSIDLNPTLVSHYFERILTIKNITNDQFLSICSIIFSKKTGLVSSIKIGNNQKIVRNI